MSPLDEVRRLCFHRQADADNIRDMRSTNSSAEVRRSSSPAPQASAADRQTSPSVLAAWAQMDDSSHSFLAGRKLQAASPGLDLGSGRYPDGSAIDVGWHSWTKAADSQPPHGPKWVLREMPPGRGTVAPAPELHGKSRTPVVASLGPKPTTAMKKAISKWERSLADS